jgi:uncharacterized membrane protein YhiD involved in acid resistance
MIVGVSVGVLLLIAGGLTGFLLYRKNLNGSDSSEDKKEKIVKKDKSEDKESQKEKDSKKDKSKDKESQKEKDSKDDLKNKTIDIEDEDSKEIDDLSKTITDEVLDSISIQKLKDEIDD